MFSFGFGELTRVVQVYTKRQLETGFLGKTNTIAMLLYVGPGMGGGVIAVIMGVLFSVFGGLFAMIWYPIKRLFKKGNTKQQGKG